MQMRKVIKFFIIIGILIIATPVLAVQLNLESDIETVNVGQKFWLNLMLAPEGETINAIKATVNYPQDKLTLININDGGSIISSWIEVPDIKNNQTTFAGIIPGGFSGVLNPFHSEIMPGKVISLEFLVNKGGEIKIDLNNLQVLLHDGVGTSVDTRVMAFEIIPTEKIISSSPKKEVEDLEAPEPFTFQIIKDESIFENQYVLIFNTQDKDSGIDHYEVQEGNLDFKIAKSPYLLENQYLNGKIIVKAIDRAGNERISRVGPPRQDNLLERYWKFFIVLLIIIMLISIFFLKRSIKNNEN